MENINEPMQELNPDQMEKVSGGTPFFMVDPNCPHCKGPWRVIWSDEYQNFICSNPNCHGIRQNPELSVQRVI